MPGRRRKKKRAAPQWPPLDFESSPLFQAAPVLEADAAVSNPVTAKTVAVDDGAEAGWVSPQFSQIERRVLKSSVSTCRTTSTNRGSTHPTASSRKSRFRPLRFLSDSASDAGLANSPTCVSYKNTAKLRSHRYRTAGEIGECPPNLVGLADKSEEEPNIDKENDAVDGREACLDSVFVPDVQAPNSAVPSATLHQSPALNTSPASLQCKLPGGFTTGSAEHSSNTKKSSDVCAPPTRSNTCAHDGVLRCNMCQLACSSGDEACRLPGPHLHTHNTNSLFSPVKRTAQVTSNSRTSVLDGQCSFLTPPRDSTHSKTVLALDTPACDYGLTLRQRQLKYGLREQPVGS